MSLAEVAAAVMLADNEVPPNHPFARLARPSSRVGVRTPGSVTMVGAPEPE
jgi:hypothetical protein